MTWAEPLAAGLVAIGVAFVLAGTLGLLRFPDVYTRLHASSLASGLGIGAIVLGSALYHSVSEGALHLKELLALLFLLLTGPLSVHVIARAAYRTGVPLADRSVRDEWRDVDDAREEAGGGPAAPAGAGEVTR